MNEYLKKKKTSANVCNFEQLRVAIDTLYRKHIIMIISCSP